MCHCFAGVTREFLSGSNQACWLHAVNWVTAELNTSASALHAATRMGRLEIIMESKQTTQEMTFQKSASRKQACPGKNTPSITKGKQFVMVFLSSSLSTAEINMAQHAILAVGFSNKEIVGRGNKYMAVRQGYKMSWS